MSDPHQDELTEEEAAKRRDQIAKRMLNTPPKPHKVDDTKKGDAHGIEAIRGTAESDADPRNPNVITESASAGYTADSS